MKFAKAMFYTCLSFCPEERVPLPGVRAWTWGDAWSWGRAGLGRSGSGVMPGLWGAWWRPPLQTATAGCGTHPTGMHSCFISVVNGAHRSAPTATDLYRSSAQTVTRLVASSETDRETRMLFQAACS